MAPTWADGLVIWIDRRTQRQVMPSALRDAILAQAMDRGPTFRAMRTVYGGAPERRTGTTELRGRSTALTVVVNVDENPLARIGGHMTLGNRVSVQVRRAQVEGRPASEWSGKFFESASTSLTSAWAAVVSTEEYWHKVMSDGPGVRALGVDFSSYLPGLFSSNFFGPRYVDLIGDRLMDVPSARLVGEGVLVTLAADPADWSSTTALRRNHEAAELIGPQYFFSKQGAIPEYVAPQWGPEQS